MKISEKQIMQLIEIARSHIHQLDKNITFMCDRIREAEIKIKHDQIAQIIEQIIWQQSEELKEVE